MTNVGKGDENAGFTMVELVMVILLLGIISVAAVVKWPADMSSQAAKMEFKHAVRFAQNMALTRQWSTSAEAWSISVNADKYYVGRANAGCQVSCSNPECAEEAMCNRTLMGDAKNTIGPATATLSFNGLGEPIDAAGVLLGNTTFVINGTEFLTVCAETGYVLLGNSCP